MKPLASVGCVKCLMVLLLTASLGSCAIFRELGLGGDDPEWIENSYAGVSRSDVVHMLSSIVARNYSVKREDPYQGELESSWLYGWDRLSHREMRERVLAEADREDSGEIVVKLRVQREVSKKMGRFTKREDSDWKPFDDDVSQAKILMQHLRILITEVAPQKT